MTKACPNCRHACFHLAPTCEECGWDFTEDKLPRLRDDWQQTPTTRHVPSVAARPETDSLPCQTNKVNLYHDDCSHLLDDFAENSIDALVTDPPAGIAFMGKEWDNDKGGKSQWVKWLSSVLQQCLYVLKPGAHALVWALPRTSHWTMNALDDAEFEIRDIITHIQAQGFPKGQDVSKAVDKHLGAERNKKLVPTSHGNCMREGRSITFSDPNHAGFTDISEPVTEQAKRWNGWNTALKPAVEFWILARKPLGESTIARNVLRWRVGGLNVEACPGNGRYPANLVMSGEELPEWGRFFYCPKASKKERNAGLQTLLPKVTPEAITGREEGSAGLVMKGGKANLFAGTSGAGRENHHPTVKPLALMSYLCRLVTPPGGTVLDPFMGSGSTGVAALNEGFKFMGIEQDKSYFQIAQERIYFEQTCVDERRANHA